VISSILGRLTRVLCIHSGLNHLACKAIHLLSVLHSHASKGAGTPADDTTAVAAVVGCGEEPTSPAAATSDITEISQTRGLVDISEALQNRKLSRKLSVVLDDVVSVASGCMPDWCRILSSMCPFLFSLSAREQLVKCSAFGMSQAIFWLQEQRVDPSLRRRLREAENTIGQVTDMTGDRVQRAYDRLLHAQEAIERQRIGKLRSDIARVSRDDRLLAQADKLMDIHANVTRMLEVQFVNEHGFGWGVTQGFYTAVALELQRADDSVSLWRSAGPAGDNSAWAIAGGVTGTTEASGTVSSPGSASQTNRVYLQVGAEGLFPRPLHACDPHLPEVCKRMRFLGRLIAKAFRDGFNVPLPLAPSFFAASLLDKRLSRAHLPLESSTGGFARSLANLLQRCFLDGCRWFLHCVHFWFLLCLPVRAPCTQFP
jgi:hypothetical protein